jgi:hypothetical protein
MKGEMGEGGNKATEEEQTFDSPQAGFLPFCRNQSAPLSSDAFSASWLSKEGQAEHAFKSLS